MKTSVYQIMRIQPISLDEQIGSPLSYEAENLSEEINIKGKKVIPFKADYNDAVELTSSEDEDDEDKILLTRRFKNLMRKGKSFKRKKTNELIGGDSPKQKMKTNRMTLFAMNAKSLVTQKCWEKEELIIV